MVGLLRLKKSSTPFAKPQSSPTTSGSGPGFTLPEGTPYKEGDRWSGENLIPSDGYSGLFTSGLMHCQNGTVEAATPLKPKPQPKNRVPAPSAFDPNTGTNNRFPSSAAQASGRHRRSSILATAPTSPAKYKSTPSSSVETAINRLKIMSIASTPSPHKQQSRWSSSSEETIETLPRKSGESVRSKFSMKSRKSEDREKGRPAMEDLMEVDQEQVPPVPKMPEGQAAARAPYTPRRMNALRRFLTPKKKQAGPPPTPAPSYPLPPVPVLRPSMPFTPAKSALPTIPSDRPIPKKSSFASLKSLAKKGSSTTLRGLFRDEEPIPCLPPTTPSRQHLRPAKSSIGPPTHWPAASPSAFLNELPRRAPTTPRKETDSVLADLMDFEFGGTPEMSFSTTPGSAINTSSSSIFTPGVGSTSFNPGLASGSANSTPAWTPLTAKAQRARPVKGPLQHFLPPSARLNHGLARSSVTNAAVGHEHGTPEPSEYAIINSYSRTSMGPSNNSSKSFNLFKAVVGKSNADSIPDHDIDVSTDSATFGKRSTVGSRVDFTASPSKRIKKSSDSSIASASSGRSGSSGGRLNDSFEFEKYLSDFKARDMREAMLGNRV